MGGVGARLRNKLAPCFCCVKYLHISDGLSGNDLVDVYTYYDTRLAE